MATILKYVRLTVAAPSIAIVFAFGAAVWPQAPTLSITLAGQSMIRSDVRVYRPSAVSTIASLLKGDVKFTNFEATVAEPGQPNAAAPTQGTGGGSSRRPKRSTHCRP